MKTSYVVSSHVLVPLLRESHVTLVPVQPGHHGHPGHSVVRHAEVGHAPGSESVARVGTMASVREMMRRLRLVMLRRVRHGQSGHHGHSVLSLVVVELGKR